MEWKTINTKQGRLISWRSFNSMLLLVCILGLMNLASAQEIYAGESITLTLPEEYAYWSVIGNSTPINLSISQDGLQVTITPEEHMQGDSFELMFFNAEKETIIVYQSSGGGGGGRTKYRDRNVTVYEDKIIEGDCQDNSCPLGSTEEPEEQEEKLDSKIIVRNVLIGILTIILICLAFYMVKIRKLTNNN